MRHKGPHQHMKRMRVPWRLVFAVFIGILIAASPYAFVIGGLMSGIAYLTAVAITAVALALLYRLYYLPRYMAITTMEELVSLPPREFEGVMATLLEKLGFKNVEVVGGPSDLARDIVCEDEAGRTTIVQCKRYSPDRPVSSGELQKFIGMMMAEHKADRGIYITTSRLTRPAMELAKKHGIEVWDGGKLVEILRGSGMGLVQQPRIPITRMLRP